MKILWVVNVVLPEISSKLGLPMTNAGGWLRSLIPQLAKGDDIQLTVVAPYAGATVQQGEVDGVTYMVIPRNSLEAGWDAVMDKASYDVIHIHGTEFNHGKVLMDRYPKEKYVVSIQGLVSVIAEHYNAHLPNQAVKKKTFRDFLKGDSIEKQAESFKQRGIAEKAILLHTENIIGRTNWDRACTGRINPKARYFHCNESLRDSFYNNKWDIKNCERHSIFISQASYPIKGFHLVLEALPELVKDYPDLKVYVAGRNITDKTDKKAKLKMTYYGKYLLDLIEKYNLQNNVVFTGSLSEEEMCERMRKSHVFISASSIENSPNSLGEAMLMGVPCVASDVGGVTDMMCHKEEGFVYPADEYYMISYYVRKIFEDDGLALEMSKKAMAHAQITHDREKNFEDLLSIYNSIIR